jgi:hypothetical protein
MPDRLRAAPVETLTDLGVKTNEDWEFLMRVAHAQTTHGKADPKATAYAAELHRRQSVESKADKALRENETLREQLAARDAQAAMQQRINTTFSAVPALASDKTPHARHVLTTNAARANQDMARLSYEIVEAGGDIPAPKALLVAYEKRLRQDYRDRYGAEAEKVRREALGKPANDNAAVKTEAKVETKAKPAAKPAAKVEAPVAPDPDDLPPINTRALDPMRERILAGIAAEKRKSGGN